MSGNTPSTRSPISAPTSTRRLYDDFGPPSLRFLPRAYSLSCSEGIDGAEAQGRALIDAAAFARTLTTLLA